MKATLKNKSVRFIGISIDVEPDKNQWIDRCKKLNIFNTPYQYRLSDPKHSEMVKFFNIYNIPRYIVIDSKGNILEEDFVRPGNREFTMKLEKYLRDF